MYLITGFPRLLAKRMAQSILAAAPDNQVALLVQEKHADEARTFVGGLAAGRARMLVGDVASMHLGLATGELRNTAVYVDTDGKVMLTDSIDYNILMRASALITGYQRMPFAQANPFVFVNNIVYNWGGVGTQFARQRVASGGEFIMDNNHYKMGPLNSQAWSPKPILLRDFWVPGVHIYLNGNYAPDWAISQQWDLVDNRTATPSYSQADLQVFTPGAWPAGRCWWTGYRSPMWTWPTRRTSSSSTSGGWPRSSTRSRRPGYRCGCCTSAAAH